MDKDNQHKKNVNSGWLVAIGLLLVAISIISAVLFLLNGETKVTGNWSGSETSESLTCKGSNIDYPVFSSDRVNSETKINAVFNGDTITSISLLRQETYNNAREAKVQSDSHEFDLNSSFANNGQKAYALNANFSINETRIQMSLYASGNDLSNKTAKYFLLDVLPSGGVNAYEKQFKNKGFVCETITEK